jgi:hypothetical protein
MNHATQIKNALEKTIAEHIERRDEFVRNPNSDFIRNRKLNMEDTIRLILEMGDGSLPDELEKYFWHSEYTPSKSAFVQQRQKLLPSVFQSIFCEFNGLCEDLKLYKGYRLYAADGTDLNVAHDPEADSYIALKDKKGHNQLHINALYDLCNKTYTDILVQPKTRMDERGALETMLKRNTFEGKSIIILDRGYEGYNTIAHLLNTKALILSCVCVKVIARFVIYLHCQ